MSFVSGFGLFLLLRRQNQLLQQIISNKVKLVSYPDSHNIFKAKSLVGRHVLNITPFIGLTSQTDM